jgi:hypothetical protein
MAHDPRPLESIRDESLRLLSTSAEAGIEMRLLGGLAVELHIPPGARSLAPREYKDIDLVTTKKEGRSVRDLLAASGYDPDVEFNTIQGHRRLLFYDQGNSRQVDVFVGEFEMCHKIPVADRLSTEPLTIPLAELLLTKLQIYELNEKDQVDILNLLCYCEVDQRDEGHINADVVARLCGRDWGLWRTAKLNFERIREAVTQLEVGARERDLIGQRLDRLWDRIESEKKSRTWRLRSRIGDRARWYEEPEEVHQ